MPRPPAYVSGVVLWRLVQLASPGIYGVASSPNYIEFHVSWLICLYKNIYSGTGSGIPLYLGLCGGGLSDKVVETVSDLSFADLPSLLLMLHYL